jgi:hypothetical protein
MRTYFSTADQEIVRAIRILKEAHEDCQGATFSSVGVDALIAAWKAFQGSRIQAKEGRQEFFALLDEATKAQENGHELHLTKAHVGIWFEHLEISLATNIDTLIYKLYTWIHPLSPTSGGVSYHPLDFEMDRTKDYSIGLSFDDSGKIVLGPQMDLDGIDGLAKRLFFFMVATTDKLEAWKAAGKGGKLAFPEVCTIQVLSGFSNTPNKLRELQPPQHLTFSKLQKALKKNKGVDLTAQDVSTILEAMGPIARPESKVGPESPPSTRT